MNYIIIIVLFVLNLQHDPCPSCQDCISCNKCPYPRYRIVRYLGYNNTAAISQHSHSAVRERNCRKAVHQCLSCSISSVKVVCDFLLPIVLFNSIPTKYVTAGDIRIAHLMILKGSLHNIIFPYNYANSLIEKNALVLTTFPSERNGSLNELHWLTFQVNSHFLCFYFSDVQSASSFLCVLPHELKFMSHLNLMLLQICTPLLISCENNQISR